MGCRVVIPDFVSPDCPFETGRVVALALFHKDLYGTISGNPSSPDVWVDVNYSADLHIFKEVRGTYSGGQPTEINGLGRQSTRVINAEHTLGPVAIEGVKSNEGFWNEIVKSNDYRCAFVVGQNYDTLLLQGQDTSIYANCPVEEGLDTEFVWQLTIKWRDINNPQTSDVPIGIFE